MLVKHKKIVIVEKVNLKNIVVEYRTSSVFKKEIR